MADSQLLQQARKVLRVQFVFSMLVLSSAFSLSPTAYAEEASAKGEIIVYSSRKEHLIKPVFELYTEQTGVKVKYVTDKAGPLIARLKNEGANTPADVFMTVDAGNLWHAASEGLLQAYASPVLKANVPAHLRDPQNRWFGLSVRARTIFYNSDLVAPEELSSYQKLGDKAWHKRLCLRTSKKVYNQSLVAMLIAADGEQSTEATVRAWVNNLAAPPFSSDTKMLEAVAAGQCAVGVANTYYYGRLMKKSPSLPLSLFWANQKAGGAHVNISGAGITAQAKNTKQAQAFLDWLSGAQAQKVLADANMEYPVNEQVSSSELVQSWGDFIASDMNLSKAGELQVPAVKLMDRAGYR